MCLSLVVLAAGIGSRYGGLKQMDPVGLRGEFIIDYSVFDALRAGFDRVVFVIRAEIEKDFRSTIGARIEKRVETVYVHQRLADLPAGFEAPAARKKPWGTGHALLAARGAVSGPFASINADDFYGRESYGALGRFLALTERDPSQYAMVGFVLGRTLSEHGTVARGVCEVDAAGILRAVVERTKIEPRAGGARFLDEAGAWQNLGGDELASMNMWGFKPSLFGRMEEEFCRFLGRSAGDPGAEFFIPSVVNALVASGPATVRVLKTPCWWYGITYAADKPVVMAEIRRRIASGDYPDPLWG